MRRGAVLAQTVRATTVSSDWISPLTISRKYIRSGLGEERERERENQLFVVSEHTRTHYRYTCPKAKRGPIFDFLRQLKKGEGNDLLAWEWKHSKVHSELKSVS